MVKASGSQVIILLAIEVAGIEDCDISASCYEAVGFGSGEYNSIYIRLCLYKIIYIYVCVFIHIYINVIMHASDIIY